MRPAWRRLRALDCSCRGGLIKRRALRRFLDAAAPAASGAQTPGGPADAAAARLHAWVASALAAADAAAHARAGDDEAANRAGAASAAAARRARSVRARRPPSKRRARTPASPNQTGPTSPSRGAPPASLAADVVVTSKLRDERRPGSSPIQRAERRGSSRWSPSPTDPSEARGPPPGTSVERRRCRCRARPRQQGRTRLLGRRRSRSVNSCSTWGVAAATARAPVYFACPQKATPSPEVTFRRGLRSHRRRVCGPALCTGSVRNALRFQAEPMAIST